MKKPKLDTWVSFARQRSVQILMALAFLYLLMVTLEIPFVFMSGLSSISQDLLPRTPRLRSEQETQYDEAPTRPLNWVSLPPSQARPAQYKVLSSLVFNAQTFEAIGEDGFSKLHKSAKVAWALGWKLWQELQSESMEDYSGIPENRSESCPHSIALTGPEFLKADLTMVIPCGLTLGSHVTVVGKPRNAHKENVPKIAMLREGEEFVMVSQFVMELQGLRVVEGEEPPRIFHFNPRLMGDWARKPVIEQNTCYRMHWGSPIRCEGWKSNADDETVDGHVKCEKWILDDNSHSEESKITWWLSRLIGRKKKVTIDWPYPFSEGKLFVLTLSAGLEGYHVNVDGRHITSFPYRTGFGLEDATGFSVSGDIDVHTVLAASLPTSHPSFAPQRQLEMSSEWQAPPLPDGPVEVFIGVLSAGGHFAERMAVRKSWMQHNLIKSSNAVARFFVAMNARKEVNAELKKEADFFGDIVMVPYLDNYDLVVLKTVAICEYGVRTVAAKYIMKCDDDTFVRLGASIAQAKAVPDARGLYIGNINFYHRPLRYGKWAVTYEEWPEEAYPPYANGPGYILSSDIAQFIVTEFERHRLRLFKMEDVSVGMWVEQFNATKPVEYLHNPKFCQFGCIEGFYTAHYQSPRQMICLWAKFKNKERPQCCNMR